MSFSGACGTWILTAGGCRRAAAQRSPPPWAARPRRPRGRRSGDHRMQLRWAPEEPRGLALSERRPPLPRAAPGSALRGRGPPILAQAPPRPPPARPRPGPAHLPAPARPGWESAPAATSATTAQGRDCRSAACEWAPADLPPEKGGWGGVAPGRGAARALAGNWQGPRPREAP